MFVGTNFQLIDPSVGCEMEGYTSRTATGHHDHLSTSVFYLRAHQQVLVFVALDLVAVPSFRADRIRRRLLAECEIHPETVIIAAIHTHSGPTVTDLLLDAPKLNENYWQLVTDETVLAVKNAMNSAVAVDLQLKTSQVPEGVYANRAIEGGAYNRQVTQLVATAPDGQLVASLLLLGTHPTVMNVKNTELSADLVGAIRSAYQKRFGVRPVVMLTDCGDTSTRYTRQESTFAEVLRLAAKFMTTFSQPRTNLPVEIEHIQHETVTAHSDYDPITEPLATALWRHINEITNTASGNRQTELSGFRDTYAHIRWYGHTHFVTRAEIYDLGPIRIVTYPGELVHALGTRIRHADEKPTLLISLANDYRGYSVNEAVFGQYFESYNSVFLKGVADQFVHEIVAKEQDCEH